MPKPASKACADQCYRLQYHTEEQSRASPVDTGNARSDGGDQKGLRDGQSAYKGVLKSRSARKRIMAQIIGKKDAIGLPSPTQPKVTEVAESDGSHY